MLIFERKVKFARSHWGDRIANYSLLGLAVRSPDPGLSASFARGGSKTIQQSSEGR
jgi:hypothetical protein